MFKFQKLSWLFRRSGHPAGVYLMHRVRTQKRFVSWGGSLVRNVVDYCWEPRYPFWQKTTKLLIKSGNYLVEVKELAENAGRHFRTMIFPVTGKKCYILPKTNSSVWMKSITSENNKSQSLSKITRYSSLSTRIFEDAYRKIHPNKIFIWLNVISGSINI